MGVNPGPLTLRELLWMAEGRGKAEWAQTSTLLALLANAHRDPKKHGVFKPADFDPYQQRNQDVALPKTKDLSILKAVFVDRK